MMVQSFIFEHFVMYSQQAVTEQIIFPTPVRRRAMLKIGEISVL